MRPGHTPVFRERNHRNATELCESQKYLEVGWKCSPVADTI